MLRSKPTGERTFFPNIARSARPAALSAILGRGNGLSLVFFETFSECEYAYSRLKYFMELGGEAFSVKVLPANADASQSDAGSFDAACERIPLTDSQLLNNWQRAALFRLVLTRRDLPLTGEHTLRFR